MSARTRAAVYVQTKPSGSQYANSLPKKKRSFVEAHHWSTDHTYNELGVRGVDCETRNYNRR